MKKKDEELKNWDITYVQYRSEIVAAKTKEEASVIAEDHRLPNERVGPIEETDEEWDK